MRLVTIDVKLYKTFKQDKEFLHNANRPCVLVLRLNLDEGEYEPVGTTLMTGAELNKMKRSRYYE